MACSADPSGPGPIGPAPPPPGSTDPLTDAFSGSLYWLAPGQEVDLWIGLFRIPTGEHVLGPYGVAVQRRAHEPVEEPAP